MRRSLSDRARRQAQNGTHTTDQLLRQFMLQRFLARVFADPDGSWVLKGGIGLLIRLPAARHSQDIDLLNTDRDTVAAVKELQHLANSRQDGDPLTFTFVLGTPVAMSGGVAGVRVPVETYLGARVDRFTIDLSTELHMVGRLERTYPDPVLDVPWLPPLPEFVLYPLADQVADKVCAMYERHGEQQRPSSRYRDLVDILLIIGSLALDAEQTITALAAESHRRGLTLPAQLTEPDPQWTRGYREIARTSTLDPLLHDLQTALTRAGACLDPLLKRQITAGNWNYTDGTWQIP